MTISNSQDDDRFLNDVAICKLRRQVHNAQQNTKSLKVKKKRLTGKINALKCDLEHSQLSLTLTETKLEAEQEILKAKREELEKALRDASPYPPQVVPKPVFAPTTPHSG